MFASARLPRFAHAAEAPRQRWQRQQNRSTNGTALFMARMRIWRMPSALKVSATARRRQPVAQRQAKYAQAAFAGAPPGGSRALQLLIRRR